jgi:peptide/nickel transport system permease protein
LVELVVVLVAVTLFCALLVSLIPGDPAEAIAPFASDEQRAALRADLNLDDGVHVRYINWLSGFVRGDFGNYYSVSSSRPVADDIAKASPVSLQLMLYAQVLSLAVAVPLGVLAASRADSTADRLTNVAASALLAVPAFALALVLSYYVGTKFGWLPPLGYTRFGDDPLDHLRRMVLPTVSLGAAQVAVYLRVLRTDMVSTLQEDFVTLARSKGIRPARVLWRHALRPSSLTLLTVAGFNVGTLIGGALLVEVVFSLPGLGMLIAQSIAARQYVALQSLVALVSVAYVLVNFVVDSLYSVLDPRIRRAR